MRTLILLISGLALCLLPGLVRAEEGEVTLGFGEGLEQAAKV